MARKALAIVLIAAAACLVQGNGGFDLSIRSVTTVQDGMGHPAAMVNMTVDVSGYNRTRDSAMVDYFLQNQITKLQKTPELFDESDTFGRRPPPPHGPLIHIFSLKLNSNLKTGPDPASNVNFTVTVDVYARRKRGHEALFALRAPTF